MRINDLVFVCGLLLTFALSCTNNSDKQADEKNSDSSSSIDSADLAYLASDECYIKFFHKLPKFTDSNSAFLEMGDGKKVSMTQFFKDEFMSPVSQYGTKDMDGDAVPELIIYNNTGGAHCCDEYYVFSRKGDNQYLFKAHLMGGGTCIDAGTNTFTFSFNETFGYFFSCYACEFKDSTNNFKTMREIYLKYINGRLQILPYDKAAEKQNLINLDILQKHGFEKVEGLMDNGWRKEFAMNFAVWHFNHGQKWDETRAIFNRYYQFRDAAKIWEEFYNTLNDSRKENTF
ncbi:MAG: hypothetical protein WKF97_25790 [Chitinophagaceae bacterium]